MIRDQFWALIQVRFADLETIARVLFKSKSTTYVPSLQSHKGTPHTSTPVGTPIPLAAPVIPTVSTPMATQATKKKAGKKKA